MSDSPVVGGVLDECGGKEVMRPEAGDHLPHGPVHLAQSVPVHPAESFARELLRGKLWVVRLLC